MALPKAPGYAQMLKESVSHYSGVKEAVIRSIEGCVEFAKTLKTAYGPKGLSQIIDNHFEKLFVTNDAANVIKESNIHHPAARPPCMGPEIQVQEVGDGTDFVMQLAEALLQQAEELIRMGLKPIEVIQGYELAKEKVLDEFLATAVCEETQNSANYHEMSEECSQEGIASPHVEQIVKLQALIRGRFVRQLLATEKVQSIVQTIKETVVLLDQFNKDAQTNLGDSDLLFYQSLGAQLDRSIAQIHDIFFTCSKAEQLKIIQRSKEAVLERTMRRSSLSTRSEKPKTKLESPEKKRPKGNRVKGPKERMRL